MLGGEAIGAPAQAQNMCDISIKVTCRAYLSSAVKMNRKLYGKIE